ncbi:hypothetical protein ACOME3_006657, partial [Neoechinorhynchus agilis]
PSRMVGRFCSITTKSGKTMNPTDQARKEARRRELKRNKRQRMIVRQSVLKNKQPEAIMRELQAVDEMEFDPLSPPLYNLKVLQEKRRKLRETWDRVKKLYETESPEKLEEMKKMEKEYENRRIELCAYYESVQHARKVKLEEIPLPEGDAPSTPMPVRNNEPFGTVIDAVVFTRPNTRLPPGPPPGPPPPLSSDEEDEHHVITVTALTEPRRKTRFSDAISNPIQDVFPPLPSQTYTAPPPPPPPPNPPRIMPLAQTVRALAIAIPSQSTLFNNQPAVIEAKPQIRQRMNQVVKMVPTVVKLKKNTGFAVNDLNDLRSSVSSERKPESNTDEAYAQFMDEIDKLI